VKQPTAVHLATNLDRIASRAGAAARAIDRANQLAEQLDRTTPGEIVALAIQIRAELAEARVRT